MGQSDVSSSSSRAGDSFNGDARLFTSGFGKGAVVVGSSEDHIENRHVFESDRAYTDCKGRIGCKPKVAVAADTYFLRFKMGQVQHASQN